MDSPRPKPWSRGSENELKAESACDETSADGVYGMRDMTDAKLVHRCLDGHKEFFAELIRRYQASVFGLAYRMTNNRDEAADLAQEAFIKAYRKLHMYNDEYSFRNWVLSICSNLTKNRFRSRFRQRKAEEAHLQSYADDADGSDPQRHVLEQAISGMKQTLRVPLVLKHVEGLPYVEIADVLGIGVSAAKMRVKRGRDELVRLLRTESGGVQ